MTDTDRPSSSSLVPLAGRVSGPWRELLERFEPLRPELYRYCRYLARRPTISSRRR